MALATSFMKVKGVGPEKDAEKDEKDARHTVVDATSVLVLYCDVKP